METEREAVDVKFQAACEAPTNMPDAGITPFTVQFVDGHNKMLIVQSIMALILALVPWQQVQTLRRTRP